MIHPQLLHAVFSCGEECCYIIRPRMTASEPAQRDPSQLICHMKSQPPGVAISTSLSHVCYRETQTIVKKYCKKISFPGLSSINQCQTTEPGCQRTRNREETTSKENTVCFRECSWVFMGVHAILYPLLESVHIVQ